MVGGQLSTFNNIERDRGLSPISFIYKYLITDLDNINY